MTNDLETQQRSPKRKRKLRKVREILDAEEVAPEIRIIDGLRYVVPYSFVMRTYAKQRWFDKSILDVLTREFQAYPPSYYSSAITSGKIKVNSEIVGTDYLLKDHDFISHQLHRHEPPVLDKEIEIIHQTDQVLVVCKPASIPIHTTGRYRHNTLLKILELRFKQRIFTCHRLDRLTSGIIVLLKNAEVAKKYGELFREQRVKKSYLALCTGEFPAEGLSCSLPLLQVSHKLGINKVDHENGKPAHTDFTRLHHDTESGRSLVLCSPRTGKMHQIRVHLAHHGFPIPNDPIYSRENWAKKSTAEFSKELTEALFRQDNVGGLNGGLDKPKETLKEDDLENTDSNRQDASIPTIPLPNEPTPTKAQTSPPQTGPEQTTISSDGIKTASSISCSPDGDFLLDGKRFKRIPRLSYQEGCPDCGWTRLVPQPEDMFLYLHAVRYELDGNVYVSSLPEWCPDEWVKGEIREFLKLD